MKGEREKRVCTCEGALPCEWEGERKSEREREEMVELEKASVESQNGENEAINGICQSLLKVQLVLICPSLIINRRSSSCLIDRRFQKQCLKNDFCHLPRNETRAWKNNIAAIKHFSKECFFQRSLVIGKKRFLQPLLARRQKRRWPMLTKGFICVWF